MNLRILFFIPLFGSSCLLYAQQRVADKEFNEMLNELLAHSVTEVTPSECYDDSDIIIYLDAREKKEYKVSHLPDARWVGFLSFHKKQVKEIPLDAKIVVYCSIGYRSEKITEKLENVGYTNVSNLYGGIFEWVHAGNDVYNEHGKTDSIHGYNKKWSQWLKKGIKVY